MRLRVVSYLAALATGAAAGATDVGRCLASPAPCDESAACSEAPEDHPHACLAERIPAWSVPFATIQCCFRCCLRFWLDEFGLRRNHELWSRAFNELHPKDKLTMEHVARAGLDELPPHSAMNVNSRVASLAHYYVEFRGRASLLDPSHARYRPSTAREYAAAVREKHRASFAAAGKGDFADLRRPARAETPLGAFRPPRRNLTLVFTSPGIFLRSHVRWAAAHLPRPIVVVAGGDAGVSDADVCAPGDALCGADGCLDRRVVAEAFVQNVARVEPCRNVRPLAQGVKHASWARLLTERHANLTSAPARATDRPDLLLCSYMAAHPGRVEKVAALAAAGFDCDWNRKPSVDAYALAVGGSKFVAAPRGIGQTCMREWEAIALGAVPVYEAFPPHAGDLLYGSAPRVEIADWAQVTPAFLEARWADLIATPASVERAFFPFWLHEITARAARSPRVNYE